MEINAGMLHGWSGWGGVPCRLLIDRINCGNQFWVAATGFEDWDGDWGLVTIEGEITVS